MPSSVPPVRWGILGTAQIANKNWRSIRNSGNAIVAAVASREVSRAQEFIAQRQLDCPFDTPPVACAGYDELLQRDDIDAIYAPLPTGVRHEWLLKAARAGKHVLSEKPCAVDASQLRELLAVCRERNLQFMDGVMFMHSARLPAVRQVLDDGTTVGDLKRLSTQFSFLGDEEFLAGNIRANSQLEPHGCLGDLGWYCIRWSLWVLREKLPRQVAARQLAGMGTSADGLGVPLEFSAELFFDGGVSASFYCAFLAGLTQWTVVSGTRGQLFVNDFVLPRHGPELLFEARADEFQVSGCDFEMHERSRTMRVPEDGDGTPRSQEAKMIHTFSQHVLDGRPDSRWGDWALGTQRVLDACRKSAAQGGRPVELE